MTEKAKKASGRTSSFWHTSPVGSVSLVFVVIVSLLSIAGLLYTVYSLQKQIVTISNKIESVSSQQKSAIAALQEQQKDPQKPPTLTGVTSIANSAKKGASSAKVGIVEFSDFECPFCKRAFTNVATPIWQNYVETGKVVYSFRHMPLMMHEPNATHQALATECARLQKGDAGFWTMYSTIFSTTQSNKTNMTRAMLSDFAAQQGLAVAAFDACVDSAQQQKIITGDIEEATKLGITGTPGFLIGTVNQNGEVDGEIVRGALPYENFRTIIEKYLAK